MAKFFDLSVDERLEALAQAADTSGRPPHLLEKDIWVVWALRHLFAAPYAPHLIFKGGTSLGQAARFYKVPAADVLVAAVGGGSNAMGMFADFIDEPTVAL